MITTLHNNESAFENFSNLLNKIILDVENTGTEITSENINIYYGYMSNEMKEKYGEILHPILTDRRAYIDSILDLKLKDLSFSYDKKGNWISYCYFGIHDTLKPIEEYIKEIKESEAYKSVKALCQTEIPDYIQLEDFKEVSRDVLFKYLNKTIGKKKWRVVPERTNIYGYRLNSRDSNKIVGLMIVRPDDSKEENTKFYICNK